MRCHTHRVGTGGHAHGHAGTCGAPVPVRRGAEEGLPADLSQRRPVAMARRRPGQHL